MYDLFLFENDLEEYKASDEAVEVWKLIEYNDYDVLSIKEGIDRKDLETAMNNYWNARNDTGLHFTNLAKQAKGKASDELEAKLYGEQN